MSRGCSRGSWVAILLLCASAARPALAQRIDLAQALGIQAQVAELALPPPSDPRFFGTYCLAKPKDFCKSIPLLPDPCVTLSQVRAQLDHIVFAGGGAVIGGGTLTIDGKTTSLAVSGSVTAHGRLAIAAAVPGLGQQRGAATLSNDGLELTTSVQNRTLSLRKDACGNRAPVVTLSAVGGPSFTLGQSVMLSGTITDEDTSFPESRIVFRSDRQGVLHGWRPAARTLVTTALAPGQHLITIAVTDSGGLTSEAQLTISVTNRPPSAPLIYLPAAGASLVAGGPVLLKGAATDPDTGALPDSALSWSVQLNPGDPFTMLGTGHELTTTFASAGDPVLLRLTATDASGASASSERTLHVVANQGNTPPVVLITVPDRNEYSGNIAGSAFAGTPASYLATVSDVETSPADLQLRWTFVLLNALGQPDTSPPQPNPAPVTGTLAPTITYPAVGARLYRVTLTATDGGGLSSSDSIDIMVTSEIIL